MFVQPHFNFSRLKSKRTKMLQGSATLSARPGLSVLCPYVPVCNFVATTSVENILNKAETLKDRLLSIENVASDEERIVCQQMLQKIYRDALIRDLEYALDHKAEVDLWNYGFRNTIVSLQTQARDKNNPKRVEAEYKLVRFLESASAFFTELLQDICSAFDLDLPFRRDYGCPKKMVAPQLFTKPKKNSCYYLCHYSLVHLGDLARYRHLGRKAELFYRFAVQLSPCTGHPYNQLALVEAGRGDRLGTVFYYVRSVSLRDPFPAAALNLMKIFSQCVDEQINVEGCAKLSATECVTVFLRFHGLIAKCSDLDVAEKYVKLLSDTLTALVATESLSAVQLVQMLAINLYALHHKRECAFINQRTVLLAPDLEPDELQAKRLVLHLITASLCAYLLPVYTLKNGESLLDYFALPAIKLTLDWIRLESQVLLEAAFLTRKHVWPSLCKLLNVVQPYLLDLAADLWGFVPLPEDRDLQCFVPLEGLLSSYVFAFEEPKMDAATSCKLRASRVLQFGIWLAGQEEYNLLKMRKESGENNTIVFELPNTEPKDVVDSNTSVAKTTLSNESVQSSQTECNTIKTESLCEPRPNPDVKAQTTHSQTTGSSVVTTQAPSASVDATKKYRNNVAMQAILKKIDKESTKMPATQKDTFVTDLQTGQEVGESNLLPTYNSQKNAVAATDGRRSVFETQVLQNRGIVCKENDPFPPLVPQHKDAYSHMGADNDSSPHVSENMKMKQISFSKMLQQLPPSRSPTEPSAQYTNLGMTNKCTVGPQSYIQDTKINEMTTVKSNTELHGDSGVGDVSSFSPPLFRPSLSQFSLPNTQDLHSAPGYNMSNAQSNVLGSESHTKTPPQYLNEAINATETTTYSSQDIIKSTYLSNIPENSKVDHTNLDPASTRSNQCASQSSGMNLTYSNSDTKIYEDFMGKVRPPPGYSSIHVPNPPVTWWKQVGSPSYSMATRRKLETDSDNTRIHNQPRPEFNERQYFPLFYGGQHSQQTSLHTANEAMTDNDTEFINSLRNINLASKGTDVNFEHRLGDSAGQPGPIYSKSEASFKHIYPGTLTENITAPVYGTQERNKQVAPNVSIHNIGNYIESGSVFPIPPRQPQRTAESSHSLFSSAQWTTPMPTQSLQQATNLNIMPNTNRTAGFGVQVAASNVGNYTSGVPVFPIPPQGFSHAGENNTYSLFSSTPWMTSTLAHGPQQGMNTSNQLNTRGRSEIGHQVAPRQQAMYGSLRTVYGNPQTESAPGVLLFNSPVGVMPTPLQATQEQVISGPRTAKTANEFGTNTAWAGAGSSALKRLLEQQNQLNQVPSEQKVT